MTPKKTDSKKLTFEDLYNTLMNKIEPELCTYNIEFIDEMYPKEKKKDKKARYEHYARCFEIFWLALNEHVELAKRDMVAFRDMFLESMKDKALGDEKSDITDIESSISDS